MLVFVAVATEIALRPSTDSVRLSPKNVLHNMKNTRIVTISVNKTSALRFSTGDGFPDQHIFHIKPSCISAVKCRSQVFSMFIKLLCP